MDYASRLFQVESGGDPNAVTPSGTYKGLAQLSPSEEAQYGINSQNRTDPAAQRAAALGIQQANAPILQSKLGRPSSPGEDYLAHQQGATGASALLTGGDTPAWQVIRPYYKSDAMAQMAISGNLPKNSGLTVNSPASSFSKYWVNKFEQTPQGALSPANQGAPVADPNTPGALSAQQLYGQGALQNGGQPPPNALGSGGVGDTLQGVGAWLQSANNPGGAAALLEQAGARRKQELALQQQFMPQVIDRGNDLLGQKLPQGVWDPRTNTMRTIGQGNQQQGAPGPQGNQSTPTYAQDGTDFSKAMTDYQQGKLDGPGLQKAAPMAVQTEAKALIDGSANPATLGNRNPGIRAGGLILAHVLDPNFNENQIPARVEVTKDLADKGNKAVLGGALASSEKIMQHIDGYLGDAQALNKLQWWPQSNDANAIQNAVKAHSTDTQYKSIVNSLNAHRDFLAGEVSSLAAGGKAAMSEREYLRNLLGPDKSLEEQTSGVRAMAGVMKGTIDPYVSKYNLAFGLNGKQNTNGKPGIAGNGEKTTEDFWNPKTTAIYNRVMSSDPTGQFNTPPQAGSAPVQGPPAPGAPPAQGDTAQRPPLSSFRR